MSFIKRSSTAICVFTALLTAAPVMAQQKTYPIESIVGARWIDRDNNTLSLTFLSVYPNGCYTLDRSAGFTATADKKIYVSQTVNVSVGLCTMALVSQTDETAILVPETGRYTVIDASTNKTLGTLIVKDGEFSYYLDNDLSSTSSD